MTFQIALPHGYVALVDGHDAELALEHKWYLHQHICLHGPLIYAFTKIAGEKVYLHRFVFSAPPRVCVDHVNHDGLDCRKANLRLATFAQNTTHSRRKFGRHGRGVDAYPGGGGFRAQIKIDGNNHRVGPFRTAEDAARAYDELARLHYGQFAVLNFPGERAAL